MIHTEAINGIAVIASVSNACPSLNKDALDSVGFAQATYAFVDFIGLQQLFPVSLWSEKQKGGQGEFGKRIAETHRGRLLNMLGRCGLM